MKAFQVEASVRYSFGWTQQAHVFCLDFERCRLGVISRRDFNIAADVQEHPQVDKAEG